MRLVWRGVVGRVRFRFQVQRLQRPSILCNPRLVFFFRCQEPFCLQSITDNSGEALFVEYVIGIRVVSMEVVSPDLWVGWALTDKMGHCLRFVVTSRALSSVGDIHVVQMLIKPYVPSDKLEGSSVVNPVVDELFVEWFYGVFVLVT